MINNAVFLNDFWLLPVIGSALVLLGIFLWKEWAQEGRPRFFIKFVLAFFAITSLVIIALKPAIQTSGEGGIFALLTNGYKTAQLDSLQKEVGKMSLINYEPGKPIPAEIRSSNKVFVLGEGIKEYDLWQLDEVPARYLKTRLPDGIIKLNYKIENSVGDELLIRGLYQNPQEGHLLVLEGPGGAGLDSIVLGGKSDQRFKLFAPLKSGGNYVFSLAEKSPDGSIVNTNALTVKVVEKDKLRILIVNSFPTFETRYLKNFLAEAGHELVVRSQLTRDRYKFEYFNTGRVSIGSLSGKMLEPFDLLIIDAPSLRSLPGSERSSIENMVREQGMGLFIQPDDTFFSSRGQLNLLNFDRVGTTELNDLQWPGVRINSYPYKIKRDFGVMEIHSSGNSLISAYKGIGEGKIGTALFSDTWHLVMEGKKEVYKELWSQLLEKLSKPITPPAHWTTNPSIVQINEPVEFELRTEIENPNVTTGSGTIIPLIQNPALPYLWKGTTWPREKGWNSLNLDTTSVHHFYVEDNPAVTALTTVKTQQANRRYFNSDIKEGPGYYTFETVNLFWFFGLFLICIGGLWLEPKL